MITGTGYSRDKCMYDCVGSYFLDKCKCLPMFEFDKNWACALYVYFNF